MSFKRALCLGAAQLKSGIEKYLDLFSKKCYISFNILGYFADHKGKLGAKASASLAVNLALQSS